MAYVISDECVACGTCAAECPAEAISEGDGKYVIDPDKCLDCALTAEHANLYVRQALHTLNNFIIN